MSHCESERTPLSQSDIRESLERDLYAVLPTPPPAKPAEAAG